MTGFVYGKSFWVVGEVVVCVMVFGLVGGDEVDEVLPCDVVVLGEEGYPVDVSGFKGDIVVGGDGLYLGEGFFFEMCVGCGC